MEGLASGHMCVVHRKKKKTGVPHSGELPSLEGGRGSHSLNSINADLRAVVDIRRAKVRDGREREASGTFNWPRQKRCRRRQERGVKRRSTRERERGDARCLAAPARLAEQHLLCAQECGERWASIYSHARRTTHRRRCVPERCAQRHRVCHYYNKALC
ncbi:hypothetical protein MRX96_036110 [Rhipicephalus microplus]